MTATLWTEEYQVELLEVSQCIFDRVEAIVGEEVWNSADFMTGPGVFRMDGTRRPSSLPIAGPRPASTSSAAAGGASP